MSTPSKEEVILRLQDQLGITLQSVPKKQLFYHGKLDNGSKVLICTPRSKLHKRGQGWTDITTKQASMLAEADHAIVAFRLEGGNVYYIGFPELREYLDEGALKNNKREGDHWKLYIWPDHIQVIGNKSHLQIEPNDLDRVANLQMTGSGLAIKA